MIPERRQLQLLTAALASASAASFVGTVAKKATSKVDVPARQHRMDADEVAVMVSTDGQPQAKARARGMAKAQPRAAARAKATSSTSQR